MLVEGVSLGEAVVAGDFDQGASAGGEELFCGRDQGTSDALAAGGFADDQSGQAADGRGAVQDGGDVDAYQAEWRAVTADGDEDGFAGGPHRGEPGGYFAGGGGVAEFCQEECQLGGVVGAGGTNGGRGQKGIHVEGLNGTTDSPDTVPENRGEEDVPVTETP